MPIVAGPGIRRACKATCIRAKERGEIVVALGETAMHRPRPPGRDWRAAVDQKRRLHRARRGSGVHEPAIVKSTGAAACTPLFKGAPARPIRQAEDAMGCIGMHVNYALTDRRVISPDPAGHRRAARAVLTAARPFALLAFRVADTHLHLLPAEEREATAEAVRRTKIALHQALRPGAVFTPAHYEPVGTQAHLERAFRCEPELPYDAGDSS